jgi:hypothetical protein
MIKREKLKRDLFRNCSENLEHAHLISWGKPTDGQLYYMCPTCYNFFDQQALIPKVKKFLTLEDAPPKSVGGHPVALTCNTCNNTTGSTIDSHLAEILRYKNAVAKNKGSLVKGVFENADFKFKGEFAVDENGETTMYLSSKANNPQNLQKLNESIQQKKGAMLSMTPQKKIDNRKTYLSVLKASHIYAFQVLGYTYLQTKTAQLIKEQLLNPDKVICEGKFYIPLPFQAKKAKVNIVLKPKDFKSLLVYIPLKCGGISETIGVFLPITKDDPNVTWKLIEKLYAERKLETLTCDSVARLNLLDSKTHDIYSKLLEL